MYKFLVNKEKCINCGVCADVCKTAKVYERVEGEVRPVHKEKCWECGQCVAACPKNAISYEDDKEIINPIKNENLNFLVELLKMRRSARLYTDEPVERKVTQELLDSTRWIPTAQNKCDVEWIVIDDKVKILKLSKEVVNTFIKAAKLLNNPALRPAARLALGSDKYNEALKNVDNFTSMEQSLKDGIDPIFHNAPVLLFTLTPKGSYFGMENSIYAGYNLMLRAAQMGLSTCRIGYFDVALKQNKLLSHMILGENSESKIQTAIILGYPKYKFYNSVEREKIKINWK